MNKMKQPTSRDFQFLFNAIVYGLLALAILQAYGPYFFPDPKAEDIKAFNRKIIPIHPAEIPPLLQRTDGKPTMLVIYASWCTWCRKTMPEIVALVRKHRLDYLSPLFISVDERSDQLASYLVHQDYAGGFTPYRVQSALADGLPHALQRMGSQFEGGIPYIAFFDAQGKPVAEFLGMVDKDTLLKTAQQFKDRN